ncbi:hypothetical protein ASPACDRAFT_77136 [Aspergillus aculeatus ATCC 16872]|uniref:Enoyl reductase (ER) domain-containing protein n=1 Tax=Aspergillus aculeatus (strain ATCC 16872 / CBS 172.66 / WB 5094) TaxID=690307 RepID=A0A1L9WYW9_ASPA1|nr:uncharacterized protein ASPACDRAFT_77136 [Aspergillus aculeatus ATCC 16872]OJK01364.1 hypothetical protein ASPACDRAFT_77136 [Aspergillus aculeatus ATCC 16872]
MTSIPQVQTAAWIENPRPHAQLELRHDVPVPEPADGEVLIKLECTGFCHSDLHCIYGELPLSVNVVGHEGVGRVVKLGPNAPSDMLGMRVGVKWLWSSCNDCPTCKVQYTNCPNQMNSGRSVPGTFQQYVVSPADFVSPIPENLKPEYVAPLLCAGLTMYGALNKLDKYCDKGDWVVIMGAGGGLGHLGIQIGKEMGYRIIAVDSAAKRDICMQSGAAAFVDFSDDPTAHIQSLTDGIGAHAVIVVVGLEKAYEQSVEFLRPVGTLVCVGLPRPDYHLPISPLMCVDRGYRIVGSAVGTEDEMQALLRMAVAGKVVTHVTVFELGEINEVAGLLGRFAVEGRAVLRIPA